MIDGTYRILYIKWSDVYLPIGLLTSESFNEGVEMIDTTTLIEWKLQDSNLTFIDSGSGYITELGDSSSIDEFITFNGGIEGYGAPISTGGQIFTLEDGNGNQIQDGNNNEIIV